MVARIGTRSARSVDGAARSQPEQRRQAVFGPRRSFDGRPGFGAEHENSAPVVESQVARGTLLSRQRPPAIAVETPVEVAARVQPPNPARLKAVAAGIPSPGVEDAAAMIEPRRTDRMQARINLDSSNAEALIKRPLRR